MTRRTWIFLLACAALLPQATVTPAADEAPLRDKTLVVWAAPASLTQRGGSALTVDANGPDQFDAIVFGELAPRVWMPGSSLYSRTQREQAGWPQETAPPDRYVHIAIAYEGKEISVYRDGELIVRYTMCTRTTVRPSAAACTPLVRTVWGSSCLPRAEARSSGPCGRGR